MKFELSPTGAATVLPMRLKKYAVVPSGAMSSATRSPANGCARPVNVALMSLIPSGNVSAPTMKVRASPGALLLGIAPPVRARL